MGLTNAYQQYQESQILTASRGKLLLMTYDGAIRFIRQAREHMLASHYEEQNTYLMKAQRIILELISTLDMKVGGDLAQRLLQIYEYVFNRLVHANVSDDVTALDEVLKLLSELREAWAEADLKVTQEQALKSGSGGYATIGRS